MAPKNVISNNALPHLTSPCVPLLCSDLTFNVNPSGPFYCLTLVLIGDFPLSNLSSSRSPITGAVRVFTQLTLKSLLLHFSDYSMFPISPSLFLLPSLCIPPPSKKEDTTVNGGFINPPGTRQAPIALFSVTNIRLFREAQKPPKGILTAFVPPYGG